MSTSDDYIRTILAKYAVNEVGAKNAGQEIYPILKRWGGQYLLSAEFSGSLAKGTAISLSADADIFLSVHQDTPGTLADLYGTLHNAVTAGGYPTRKQNVSIRTTVNGYSIDLVPGRKQTAQGNDHSLYKSKTQTWMQTNVSKHISDVLNSNRLSEIRAVKIWRELHRLEFPSLFLEMAVIDGLQGATVGNLAINFLIALGHLNKKIETVRYIDPANTNNIVSDDCSMAQKSAIAALAKKSYNAPNWSDLVW